MSLQTIRKQSAVIPYRKGKKGIEVLLITSRDTGRWVIPKGNLEHDLKSHESAEKEAFEEAGILGKVSAKKTGKYHYIKHDKQVRPLCKVDVYPMKVEKELKDWPERSERKRKWMTTTRASKRVFEKKLSKMLLGFSIPK